MDKRFQECIAEGAFRMRARRFYATTLRDELVREIFSRRHAVAQSMPPSEPSYVRAAREPVAEPPGLAGLYASLRERFAAHAFAPEFRRLQEIYRDHDGGIVDYGMRFSEFAAWIYVLLTESASGAAATTWIYLGRTLVHLAPALIALAEDAALDLLAVRKEATAQGILSLLANASGDAATNLWRLSSSRFIGALRKLLGTVVALQFFSAEQLPAVLKRFHLPVAAEGTGSYLDLVQAALASVSEVLHGADDICAGHLSWWQVIAGTGNSDLLKKLEYIRINRYTFYRGMPEQDPNKMESVSEHNLYRTVVEAQQLLETLKAHVPGQTATGKAYQAYYLEVCEVRRELEAFHASGRIAPMGIVIHGPSRCGKSTVVPLVTSALLMGFGIDLEGREISDFVFNKPRDSDFWDGYDPSRVVLHYPEVGAVKDKIAETQGDQNIVSFLALLDTGGLALNMARLEDKGRVTARPLAVITDTNVPSLNAHKVVNNPGAVLARFLFIRVAPRDEFKKTQESGELDLEKVRANPTGEGPLDVWHWEIYRQRPTEDNLRNTKVPLYSGPSVVEAMALVKRLAMEHMVSGYKAMRVRNAAVPMLTRTIGVLTPQEKGEMDMERMFATAPPVRPDAVAQGAKQSMGAWHRVDGEADTDTEEEEPDPVRPTSVRGIVMEWKAGFEPHILLARGRLAQLRSWWGAKRDTWGDRLTRARVVERNALGQLWVSFHALWITCAFWCVTRFFLSLGGAFRPLAPTPFARRAITMMEWGVEEMCPPHCVAQRWAEFRACFTGEAWVAPNRAQLRRYVFLASAAGLAFMAFSAWRVKGATVAQGQVPTRLYVDPRRRLEEQEVIVGARAPPPRAREGNTPSYPASDLQVVRGLGVEQRALLGNPYSDVRAAVVRNQVQLSLTIQGEDRVVCWVLGVRSGWAVTNWHSVCHVGPTVEWRVVSLSRAQVRGSFLKSEVVRCGDACLIPVRTLEFRDIREYFLPEIIRVPAGGLVGHIGAPTSEGVTVPVAWKRGLHPRGIEERQDVYAYSADTDVGACGLALFVEVNGITCVAGIHMAGSESARCGYAAPVLRGWLGSAGASAQSILMPLLDASPVRLPERASGLGEPHRQSAFGYYDTPGLEVYGQLEGMGVPPGVRSKVEATPFLPLCRDVLDVDPWTTHEGVPVLKFGPPEMCHVRYGDAYYSPQGHFLDAVGGVKCALSALPMEAVANFLVRRAVEGCDRFLVPRQAPLPIDQAVAGDCNDFYLRSISQSTAAGYCYGGPKSAYSRPISTPFAPQGSTVDLQVGRDVAEIIDTYLEGKMANTILGVASKDEPVKFAKRLVAKTRQFCIGGYDALVVQRMFLAPFYMLMVQHGVIFGAEVGINMQSADVDELVRRHTAMGDNHIELDYAGFDTSQLPDVGLVASTIVYRVLEYLGYSAEALLCVRGCLTDNLLPLEALQHVLFRAPGHQPSGRYATAEDNCLRNLVMVTYAWFHLCPAGWEAKMFEHLVCSFYGDDLWITVSAEAAPYFTPASYGSFCERHYGIKVTDADKQAPTGKFTELSRLSFLKRRFVYRADVGHWVAPLDRESLAKALCYRIPSKVLSAPEQMLDTASSVCRELVLHCSEQDHAAVRARLVEAMVLAAPCARERAEAVLPTWAAVVEQMYPAVAQCAPPVRGGLREAVRGRPEGSSSLARDASENPGGGMRAARPRERETTTPDWGARGRRNQGPAARKSVAKTTPFTSSIKTASTTTTTTTTNFNYERLPTLQEGSTPSSSFSSLAATSLRAPPPFADFSLRELVAVVDYANDPVFSTAYYEARARRAALVAEEATKNLRQVRRAAQDRKHHRHVEAGGDAVAQSAPEGMMSAQPEAGAQTHENLIDHPGEETATVTPLASSRPLPGSGMREQFSLDQYFARPVKIYGGVWPLGEYPRVLLRPWNSWVDSSAVRAKLVTYRFVRAKLHLKFTITGTPYHYGKVLISYQPFDLLNETLHAYQELETVEPAGQFNCVRAYLSQAHDLAVMDVQDNQPMEMVLDFVSPKQSWIVGNDEATVITNSSIFPDFFTAAAVYMRGLNPLRSASGGTSSGVTVAVYAYATDVELALPTSTDMDIVAQSAPAQKDEYRGVSSTLSAVSRAAGSLAAVPVIGSFMHTASSVAKAASSVAHFFGFSMPVQLQPSHLVKNMPFDNGATTQGMQTAFKLTVDPKQELTIDPFNAGASSSKDELAVAEIASRWSYIGTASWTSANTEGISRLAQIAVTPLLHALDETHLHHFVEQPTPMEFAAIPFQWWRGSIEVRFEIVCSKFHRGKLWIGFEPNMRQYSLVAVKETQLNEQNSALVDIQDCQVYEVRVPWCSEYEWLQTRISYAGGELPQTAFFANNEAVPFVGSVVDNRTCLGMLYVKPFTTLVQPVADAPVEINVYVRCCDLQVQGPYDLGLYSIRQNILTPGEVEEELIGDAVAQSALPIVKDILVPTGANSGHASELHFGEQIPSFRGLLKRYSTVPGTIQANVTVARTTTTSMGRCGSTPSPTATTTPTTRTMIVLTVRVSFGTCGMPTWV